MDDTSQQIIKRNQADMEDHSVSYSRTDILAVLRSLVTIVSSLDRIGAASVDVGQMESDKMLADFITEWNVFQSLVKAKRVLSEPFSTELGPDDMDELEREIGDAPHWSVSCRSPQARNP